MSSIKVRGRTTFRSKGYFKGLNSEDSIVYRRGEDSVTIGVPMLGEYRIPMGIEACVDGHWVEHPSVFRVDDELIYFRFDNDKGNIISEELPMNFTFFTSPLIKLAKAARIYGELFCD